MLDGKLDVSLPFYYPLSCYRQQIPVKLSSIVAIRTVTFSGIAADISSIISMQGAVIG